MLNKKAQISETITWVVATIIIIVILIVFIYLSSLLAEMKSINIGDLKKSTEEESDWIGIKTSIAYSIRDDNKTIIENWIKNESK